MALEIFDLGGLEIFDGKFSVDLETKQNIKFDSGTSFTMTLDHAATAARTITIPDATDTVCLLAATQELDAKTLDSSVAKGTWTASGTWTIPAVTLGGVVSSGGQSITNLAEISTNYINGRNTNDYDIIIRIGNGAGDWITALTMNRGANPVMAWGAVTHTGIVLAASQKINPTSGVAGFSVVSTALTLGSLGSVIIPQSAANVTDALAGNVAGAIGIDLTGSAERLYFRGASGWFYIAKTGGLSMTKEERVDPSGHEFEIGDKLELVVDRVNPDGSFHASPSYSLN